MAIDRARFFKIVRESLFSGALSPAQVEGCNAILDYYEQHPEICSQLPQLAYLLATTYHETAQTMQPIEEYGRGKGKPYGKRDAGTGKAYYGRGYVQLTWHSNYEKMSEKLGLGNQLVRNPEQVMMPDIALAILFRGSMDGDFTGKAIPDYIHGKRRDFVNARKVINGLDKAQTIAKYAEKFLLALV